MDKFENFNNYWIPRINKYEKVRASGDPCVQNYGLPVKSMEINLKKYNMYNVYNVQYTICTILYFKIEYSKQNKFKNLIK